MKIKQLFKQLSKRRVVDIDAGEDAPASVTGKPSGSQRKMLLVASIAGVAVFLLSAGLMGFSFLSANKKPAGPPESFGAWQASLFGQSGRAEEAVVPPVLKTPGATDKSAAPAEQIPFEAPKLPAASTAVTVPAEPADPVRQLTPPTPLSAGGDSRPLSAWAVPLAAAGQPVESAEVPVIRDGAKPAGMGKKIYDLQYDLEMKRLQLELAKVDAQIAEESAKLVSPMRPLASDGIASPDTEPDAIVSLPPPAELLPAGIAAEGAGSGGGLRVTAVSGEQAVIDGRIVRMGSVMSGMKVVSINAKSGTVVLRNQFGIDTEISM